MLKVNIFLFMLIVVCALGVVTSQHKSRKLFIGLQQEKDRQQQMETDWDRLQLEQSTLALPTRVDKIASQQLQMQTPQSKQIQFVRSVPDENEKTELKKNPGNDEI